MAYKWRDEIVGKRFLCVTTVSSSKIKVKKINEWNWRQGIIRASNRSHTKHNDLTVLVEYDGVDWRKREWIKVYDQQFHVFLIEYSIVWSTRADTVLGKNKQWLALNFKILVDKVGLRGSQLKPIEYLDDRQLDFVDYNQLKLYEEVDLTKDPYKSVSCLQKYIRQWTEYQDSQKILLTTPSVLVGYRVKVYRSEGTTQWYTAVIVSYNENTKELTLTDDTVLEERNEDPTLVQMKLIGDGVVESILKGEEIGITPRRRACNQNSRETTTATSLNNSPNTNNNYVNTNARKLTNPSSNNNSANHHPNRVKNSNLVNNLSNINVSTTTTVTTATTSTSTTTSTTTINSRVNSDNDNNNNSLTTNNCNTNDDNIRNNKLINTGNEKEIAVKTNNKASKHPDSNCIGSVMNSSVTKADVNNRNFDSSLKSNYHRFGLDLSDQQQAHSLQSKGQKSQNQEYQHNNNNNQDQVNSQQRNTSTRLNNSHNHLGSNFSSVTTASTTTKTNSQSKSSSLSSSPTSSINSTTYSNSLMHLHMTPSQSGSHLPRPPCPPNGDRTTGPPSTSIASSLHHQHQQQQQHHLHHQQQQQQQQQHIQQSHHHLTSTASSIPKSSSSSLESQNSSTMSRPPPGIISPYSNAIGNYQAMLMLQHQQELLWQKYPEMRGMTASSGNPDNRLLTPYQINDWKMIQERERDNRQLQEKMKLEDKMRERLEREAKDRESKERDKFLKERAEKEKKQREAVDQHFVESLRLANQKQRAVTTGWPQMAKGNSGNPNHPPPPQSPVRSQQQSQPPVSSSGNNSLPRSYIPMFNGDAEKESGESKSANSSNCSSRSSSSATSSHQPNNNNVNNNNSNSNNSNNNSNNNNNNNSNNGNGNSNNMVHSDARLIRNMEQRHHQQTSQATSKSQQQARSGNKVDYRSSESNLSHLHAAAAAQQFNVLSQQQSHSPNGPQHPLHLIHAPSWGVPRSGVSSDGGSPSQGKGSQSHQPGHPGALPLHLQSHHGPIGPGQLNPSQLQFVNNMSVNGSRLLAHYDAKISSLMRENSSSPSLSTTSKKTNASPVNNTNNSNNNNNISNPRDNNGNNSVNSVGSRSDPLNSKLGSNHRANSENPGPYGYSSYGYPPPPPRSSGIKDTPPPHPPPPPSLPPPHLAVGKLNSSTNISNPLTSAPNSRNCFSPMGNSLGRPPSGPSPSRPPPPAHSGGSSSSIISGPEKREPSPLIDRSGTPLSRNTGTPLGRPSSASSSKHLSGKVAHQFNSVDRISPLYHNSGSQSSSSSTSSLQSGQQGQPSGPPHSSSPFSQQTQLSAVPLMSAPPAHQSSSPGLATSRSNTPQLSSSNVQSHPPVLPSSANSSSSSAANHPSLTNLSSSSSSLPSSQDQPQNLVKSELKVRNNLNSVNSNSQSLSNSNISSKGQHVQGTHTPSYMKHSQFKAEEHKSNLINSSDRYSINGPNMDTTKQQHFTPISNAGVMSGGPGGGMYPHYMKGLSPSRYNLSSGQPVSPHVMGYEVSRSRTSGPNMPYNLTHPSNSFDGQLKGPNDHLAGGNNKAMNMNSFKVNSDVRMSAETINLDTHQAHSHHSGKGSSSIPSFSGNNTITISPASVATTLTITTRPLTSISPTGTIVKSGANTSNNGTRLVPGNLSSGYLPSNIHPMMGQSNHHLSTHSHHGQSSHPISLTNNKIPLGPLSSSPVSNGSSGSIIHGLPVTTDKKGLNVSPSMTISTKDSIEYDHEGKRKGMHKEIYDVTKKIKKDDEDNVNNRSGNSKSIGRLSASPTEFVHQTLSNTQPTILIEEEKNVYPLNENKKSPSTNHFEHDFGDKHKTQPTFNSSKSKIETPMTITSTMLPPPSLNTSNVFANSSPITPATSTPSTQSGSNTSITISSPVTTVRESPTTVTSNEPSTPSKFHPKLKKAWLQRHSEAEVESNSNQSTSSALSVNNTLNNLTSNSAKEDEGCKQPSTLIHKSQQSHHHKIKPSSQIKSDQLSDASASSSPRVKRKISREEKNKKRSKKDPSSDEDGDETSSVSDFDFNGDKSNSSAPEKSKSSKSGLIKKRITSRNTSKRHKGSGGSNSGSGSENKKDDYKWSKDERERRRKTKESKINARRGRKPKSSTRGSKESKEPKEPKESKEPKEPKEPKESKESNGNKDSFREKESKKKSSKEGSFVLKPTLEVLKKTGQPFLQDGTCYDVAPRLPKCRECRMTPNQRNKKMPNIFCRFYAFRKLKYGKNGVITDSGFSEPQDANHFDLELWLPPEESCSDLDMETSKFLINHVGDQFCDLVKQEQQALKMHMGKDKTITWKRVVQGVREMCDVCETTLFNIHWVCHKCGFVICIDCYKARKNGAVKEEDNPPRDRDEYQWLLCTNRQPHEQDKLMMTQIIASTALNDVGKMLHMIRKVYSIPAHCGCDSNSIVCANGLSIKMSDVKALRDKMESSNGKKGNILNGAIKGDSKSDAVISKDSENSTLTGFSSESGSSPLSWLADVALSSSKIGSEEAGKDSQIPNDGSSAGKSDAEEKTKDETDEHNFSTLRELLIRPTSKKSKGSKKRKKKGLQDDDNNESDVNDAEEGEDNEEEDDENDDTTSDEGEPDDIRVKKKTKKDECDDKTSNNMSSSTSTTTTGSTSTTTSTTTITTTTITSNTTVGNNKTESIKLTINSSSLPKDEAKRLEHYRRLFIPKRGIVSSPSRSCNVEETKKLFPNTPHTWLCSGKLLVLQDPKLSDNLKLFQEQWKRGQPVLVNGVSKFLDPSLWSPEEFNKSFGDSKNDLVNCKTGHVLPKLPMKKFWDGFENLNKRMKGEDGDFMTLKLKDWPPGDDFSDLLPDHYADLMECLPLPEYTRRDGCLNLAGRLPECFVRPDLGPKMYNAYGSALLQDKGTTNLHLDISDAVNIMVYVGVPKGGSKSDDFQEIALKALEEGGCDEEMKKRCREKGNKLGALWHIYEAKNADAIRDLLNKVAKERGVELGAHHDPIHDQSWYLDSTLRARLKSEYDVEGYAIAQCLGDAVFIPAGAPHQVRNLQSCIKVAGDFVSPENVTQCFNLTQEFRRLSDSHINHEDKLQIKNIIYHAIKDSLASLAVSDTNKSNSYNNKSNSVNNKNTNNTTGNSSVTPTSNKAH